MRDKRKTPPFDGPKRWCWWVIRRAVDGARCINNAPRFLPARDDSHTQQLRVGACRAWGVRTCSETLEKLVRI